VEALKLEHQQLIQTAEQPSQHENTGYSISPSAPFRNRRLFLAFNSQVTQHSVYGTFDRDGSSTCRSTRIFITWRRETTPLDHETATAIEKNSPVIRVIPDHGGQTGVIVHELGKFLAFSCRFRRRFLQASNLDRSSLSDNSATLVVITMTIN
jgi:hypothetical protein